MINKLLPFLSKYIPPALAIQGMSKVNPKLGGFIQSAVTAGYGSDSILNFIKEKIEPQGIKSERQRLEQGSAQGTLRPDEMSHLQTSKSQGIPTAIPTGIGLGVGALSSMGQQEQQMSQPQAESAQQEQDPFQVIAGYSPELAQFIKDHLQNGRSLQEAVAIARMPGKYDKYVKAIEKDTKENFADFLSRLFGSAQPKNAIPQSAAQQPVNQPGQQAQQGGGPGQQALMAILQQIQQARQGQ